MEDSFHKKMKNRSDYELNNIVANKTQFQIEAVNSALTELARRRELNELEKQILTDCKQQVLSNEQAKIAEAEIDKNKPLFSKVLIFALSFLLHPLLGVLFFSANLWDYGKANKILISILIIVAFSVIYIWIFIELNIATSFSLLANVVGSTIITEVLWRKFIGEEKRYRASRMW